MKSFWKHAAAALSIIALCFAAGCGDSADKKSGGRAAYRFKDKEITLAATPQRVIPLSDSLLSMYYAAGGKAVARPTSKNELPAEAKDLPEIGHVSTINSETLVGLNPDLVIGLQSQNQKLESILQANKIPYILLNYEGIEDNVPLLEFFGKIAGTEVEASKVITDYEQRIQAEKELGKKQTPLRVAVLRATGKDVTAETPRAVTASMVEEIGMKNVILDHVRNISAKTVPYSLEVLAADNPDIIFIVTMGKMDQITEKLEQEMTGNPAWNQLQAVENGRVYFLPSDLYLLNPGIRTPEAMHHLLELAYPDLQQK